MRSGCEARLLAAAGRDAEAEIALQRSIELNPDAPRALIELAKLRDKHGQVDSAAELYRRAARSSPLPDADLAHFGRLLRRLDHVQEAEEILSSGIRQLEDPRRARRALAELLNAQGRDAEAAALLRKSALASEDWEGWADLAAFLISVEQDASAAQAAIHEAFAREISSPRRRSNLQRFTRGMAMPERLPGFSPRFCRHYPAEWNSFRPLSTLPSR